MRKNGFYFWDILWFFIALTVGLACSLTAAHASTPATGTISGKVTDEDYTPIPDARIHITRADQVVLTAVTDESGDYTVEKIPEGKVQLTVDVAGYRPKIPESIKVQSGTTVWVNPTLASNTPKKAENE